MRKKGEKSAAVLVGAAVLFGCGESSGAVSKEEPLTVYLWENSLIKNLVPYIHEQLPDQDIEFIVGNNDTDLYSYMEEHGELPDVITVRRNRCTGFTAVSYGFLRL